uniref:DUF3456 domain-containing protein n=1 Tax=Kalanchoe fedtschenkoi TaxID=63787 RepID=A0A7N0R847_KALFE
MTDKSALACFAAILALISAARAIDDKCLACNAVAEELELGLAKEKPRNHLDLRHRLDSKGQREGKVIDYKVSDLRVVELLDGLCDKMQDYTLTKANSSKKEWVKVHDWNNLKMDKQKAKAHSKDISSYCGRLLEETEDDLAELIKQGLVKPGDVNKVLCRDLSKHCGDSTDSDDLEAEEGSDEL